MDNWLIIIGIAMIAIGLGLLTPLYDYVPIDFWANIKNLFGLGPPVKGGKIYVVERSLVGEFSLVGVGIVVLAIGIFLKLSK